MFNKQKRREEKLEREVTEILAVVKPTPGKIVRVGVQVLKVEKKNEKW